MDKKRGIYKIFNKINGKYYIGSSDHIYKRWNSHKSCLNRQIHENSHLQFAWNKYGKCNFDLIILEETNDDLLNIEQKYLNEIKENSHQTYNINFIADKPPQSVESRKKQSDSMKGKSPWNKGKSGLQIAWNKGKQGISCSTHIKMSDKAKQKRGNKNGFYDYTIYTFKNKITNEIFVGTQNDLQIKYNLPQPNVSKLIHRKHKSCLNWILYPQSI